MENIEDEYRNYWETNMFLQTEELDSYYNSTSPDGMHLSTNKNVVVSERNRRKKLNERLYALRSVVPNITKMDKASTIRDAIEYIKSLHGEEMRIQAEISELERGINIANVDDDDDDHSNNSNQEVTKMVQCHDPAVQLRVSKIGEKTIVVSLECMNSRRDTMTKLYKAFESLNLKIITSNINVLSGRLFKTVFLEGDEDDKDDLRVKIEDAITALN